MLEDLLQSRRDTRHFTNELVPDEVLERALRAGHLAPSVGLTDATRYFVIRAAEIKQEVKTLFHQYNQKAYELIESEQKKADYQALKLEAITDAPIGLVVCYDRSVLNEFTIGTIASNETLKASAVCAVQNIWLSLTEQGYSMGWVSILNYHQFKKILNLPPEVEALGYFCVGKPATDYNQQPMLQQMGWKTKSEKPVVKEIDTLVKPAAEELDAIKALSSNADTEALAIQLRACIDGKTKPLGSLGMLEELALQIGKVFGTLKPELKLPHLVVFAADHGIAQHGVSAYPQEVTRQMVSNFLEGGAAINVFCRQHGINLKIADAGVNYDFPPNADIIDSRVARGTQSFLHTAAMSASEMELCLAKGAAVVSKIAEQGSNIIGFGEMGIGNTSSASVLMSLVCNIPLADCIGKGTGVNPEQLVKKQEILKLALSGYKGDNNIKQLMAHFGGFEIIQIAGAIVEAKRKNMLILIDGFICTVAYLCALHMDQNVVKNAIFCHQSDEQGHRLLLEKLNAKPLLQLNMRLGEGTGCALAFPLVVSAVNFLRDMASFESASVSNHKTTV